MLTISRVYFFILFLCFITHINAFDLCSTSTDNITDINSYVWKNHSSKNCGCENCIRKCCKLGYYRILGTKLCARNATASDFTVPVYTYDTDHVKNVTEINNFVVGPIYCDFFVLKYPEEEFYVQEDGTAWVPIFDQYVDNDEYCIDEYNGFRPLVCFPSQRVNANVAGMIISMPFLLITLLVYLILPERNVHRKALMNYVFSLLFGYITLVTVQLLNAKQKMEVTECHILGYSIIFFFIVSFFWMNVMCIDMWLAFSGLRGFRGRRDAEKKKFILFCIYAWGMPSLLILITFLMNTYADKKAIYYPQLGDVRCFLENGYPNLFYFYLPMTILITVNVILCILTTVKIQKVKKETSMLQRGDSKRHNYESDKQKFKLYLKLIFAMGVNWSMEVISWLVQWRWNEVPEYLWYVTDFVNAAYGILIFIIFVCKKNIYYQLKKRYYVWRGKPHLAHTLSGTNTTRSAVSTTCNTVVSMDYRLNDLKNGQVENKPLSG